MLAQAAERNTLSFEILQNSAPQIVTVADIEQIEQGGDRNLMVMNVGALSEKKQPVKEMLDP
ncbi:hypothetical protein PT7_3407 [Pusillimonas sp. T7-7]|nr:hypothetical protein PT7_3407 [Pusillimonas sp. T7-7]